MQVYLMIAVYNKDRESNNSPNKGVCHVNYTASLSEAYDYINSEAGPGWLRKLYEFPSMKEVTKAEITIS